VKHLEGEELKSVSECFKRKRGSGYTDKNDVKLFDTMTSRKNTQVGLAPQPMAS
jgi:hypothetical protein